ncbi:phosphatidylcholine-sterol acyltransferase-like [Symsagittifera roscoffensis]|uniref:phosphatidylcholine-sterol acyltransferase-like n=1 Tax=Symsagittifera roscoffensis TaxID=84072 RepID=UPI00307C9675
MSGHEVMSFTSRNILLLSLCLLALISLHGSVVQAGTVTHPLLFIPGDGGSKLYAKLDKPSNPNDHWYCSKETDWYLFWMSYGVFVNPLPRNCFLDNIELVFNSTDNTTSNQPGVQIKVDPPGSTDGIRYLDKFDVINYYGKMISHFEDKGYKAGKDLMGLSYDFRKCPNEKQDVLDSMRSLTEQMFVDNQNKSVFIISHSMGGLFTKAFLEQQSQQWKNTYLAGWISIGTPMYGASSSYEMYASGYNFGVPILPSEPLKYAQRSYTSSAWMLPNPDFWDQSEPIIQTPTRNYTVLDYNVFFKDINYTLGPTVFELTHSILDLNSAPDVNLVCIYGVGVSTEEQYIYDSSFPDKVPIETVKGDGDGTVNYQSAVGCGNFKRNPGQTKPVMEKSFQGVDHDGLLQSSDVIDYVDKIVYTTL